MFTHAEKSHGNKNKSMVQEKSQKTSVVQSVMGFEDNRPEAVAQRKVQELADISQNPQFMQLKSLSEKQISTIHYPIQTKVNKTGLPDNLKSGIENLSGYSMDDVRVHYNSDKPAQLQAHAYAQGTDIHIASGQEKYLPHEAWHVVQQKQGRVKPTMQMKGNLNINDDAGLEKEEDVMGDQSMQRKNNYSKTIVQQKKSGNTAQLISKKPSARIFQLAKKGLPPGTKVKITKGNYRDQIGEIQRELVLQASYKVLLSGRMMAQQFEYRHLEEVKTETAEDKTERRAKDAIVETPEDKTAGTAKDAIAEMTQDTTIVTAQDTTAETTKDTTEQVDTPDLSTLRGQVEALVKNDDWNNADLVERIGKSSWSDIKAIWEAVDHTNKQKLILVKLRGKPYNEIEDDVTSYEGWPDNFMGTQNQTKWGTETEGGHIEVSLNQSHVKEGGLLKAKLSYFKRTALIETETHTLALDNVNDKIDSLMLGKKVLMPIEVASKPKSGAPKDVKNKRDVLDKEERKHEQWPSLRTEGGILKIKTGEPKAISKFNEYFITHSVNNIAISQKPQHVTLSGTEEDRLGMAKELESTAKGLNLGTRGKADLSGKPKTSLEFLRHSTMDEKQVRAMEQLGHQMRKSLRDKFKTQKKIDIRFADEELNGIIVPITGVPREIGGYMLATPMTNVFPLLDKGGGKVTALREYR